MTLTIAGRLTYGSKYSPRRARIDMMQVHHTASTSDTGSRATLEGAREVSANFYINSDGDIFEQVPLTERAWTSATSLDHRSATVEVQNTTASPHWTITADAQSALARLAAWLHVEHGVPLDRDHIIGHREIHERYGLGYATACPGGIDLDAIPRDALALISAPSPTLAGDDMHLIRIIENGRIYLITPTGSRWLGSTQAVAGIKAMTGRDVVDLPFSQVWPMMLAVDDLNRDNSALATDASLKELADTLEREEPTA